MVTATKTLPYEVLVEDTRMLTRQTWLATRRTGVGSSDAAPALGMSPWVSQYALWADKRGLLPAREETERFRWGHLLEPVILDELQRRRPPGPAPMQRNLMLRSAQYPWMLANPDALVTGSSVIEVKTASEWDRKRWDEGVPDHYVLQAHHLMVVCGVDRCIVPVLFGCAEMVEYEIDYDTAVAKQVIDGTYDFWERVKNDDAPDLDGSEATMLALREIWFEGAPGMSVELTADLAGHIALHPALAAQEKAATEAANALKARVMDAMGIAEVALVDGEVVATWKSRKDGRRVFRWKERG